MVTGGIGGEAELWVSVPAPHCTGPRLSAALLSLSSLPLHIFLSTPPTTASPLLSSSRSLLFPAPHLPPPTWQWEDQTCTQPVPSLDSYAAIIIHAHWTHVLTACTPPVFCFFLPPSTPLILMLTPPPPPPTHCTRSGRSWGAKRLRPLCCHVPLAVL